MAWEARSGLKRLSDCGFLHIFVWLNGLGSPFGFETLKSFGVNQQKRRLNGLGSPFGFEIGVVPPAMRMVLGLNGLGSPFGFETSQHANSRQLIICGEMAWEAF